ncbi:thioredoxin-like protein [Neoconidiobolus thromboides FSU 785]|nr:thioredoxin-like protein [Neoconidiobolus thromboides FSU 785]
MQNPNEDTEWNDILRAKGILPPKEPSKEELVEKALEEAIEAHQAKQNSHQKYEDYELDELDEFEDLEDESILNIYREKRLQEMKLLASKQKYGEIIQINRPDFIREVTEASEHAPVIVHLFKDSYLACRQLNHYLSELARQYKSTKFVKIISDLCIENYPDKNLPTILCYHKGNVKQQLIGLASSLHSGCNLSKKELENILIGHELLDIQESSKDKMEEYEDERKSIRNTNLLNQQLDDY